MRLLSIINLNTMVLEVHAPALKITGHVARNDQTNDKPSGGTDELTIGTSPRYQLMFHVFIVVNSYIYQNVYVFKHSKMRSQTQG